MTAMNKKMVRLKNAIQEYAWGSPFAIPELLGLPVSQTPWAELWMGAHPKAPSLVEIDGRWMPLDRVIRDAPDMILGKGAAKRFHSQMPYLFKVLAAAKPLSIQAHPGREQAREGFARENRLNIPLDALERNYRDENHKPECLCALTPFWALNGFRAVPQILSLCGRICPAGLGDILTDLSHGSQPSGVKKFFREILSLKSEQRDAVIREALDHARMLIDESPVFKWMVKLHQYYPGDIGVISPLFLNLICLDPGQAMLLPSGRIHAYLDGVGMELMANSDNVLRGGLTPKHIDVPEMLNILEVEPGEPEIYLPEKKGSEWVYPSHADEFELSVIRMKETEGRAAVSVPSVQILLCTYGRARITAPGQCIEAVRGDSFLVPAAVGEYTVQGSCEFYKASVPSPDNYPE
jgi:mannose-6-phosphate isomerase